MHEISALEEAVRTADKIAEEHGIDEIKCITLEIGELTGYVPRFFEEYFPIVTEDKPRLQNCRLKTRIVKGEALCGKCGALYNVLRAEGVCPKCRSRVKKILGGQEFLIKELIY